MTLTYLLVALGGSLGALTRFITNNLVSVEIPDKPYLSTLIVNVLSPVLSSASLIYSFMVSRTISCNSVFFIVTVYYKYEAR